MRGVIGETVIGRYRLEKPLSQGGFGEVWRARQLTLDRPVAVKVLRTDRREEATIRERFRREARLLASISHPHVVICHDFDVDPDGDLVLVMEYLEGRTLLDLLQHREVVSLDRIVTWIGQAAEGLWEAHARGIVHRDVKPSNLFVVEWGSRRERLKVIDFGILWADQRVHPDLERLTRTGMVVGTPEYLAPEVALGGPAGPGSDQYALALVAFEMIAGRRAFPPWDAGGGIARMGGRPDGMDFGRTGRQVPPAVVEALWRALSPIPEERHPTIRDFGDALREAAGLGPAGPEAVTRVRIGGTEDGETTRTKVTSLEPPPRSRRPGRWVAVGVALLGAVALAGTWAWRSSGPGNRPDGSPETVLPGLAAAVASGDLGVAPDADPQPLAVHDVGTALAPMGPGAEDPDGPVARPLAEAHPRQEGPSRGPPLLRDSATGGPGLSQAPPPSPAVQVAPGRLSINARPWAEVSLDGRAIGRTPIRDLEVPAGEHRVRFTHPTLGEVQQTVRILSGRHERLMVDLSTPTGETFHGLDRPRP